MLISVHVCMHACVSLIGIYICGFQNVDWSPPRVGSKYPPSFRSGVMIHGPSCEVFCSQGFVPRALFRTVTEPRTASNCSSFVVIFPGMVLNITVRFFVIITEAPTITGTTVTFFSFQDFFTSFLRF